LVGNLVWYLTNSVVTHYMYMEEQKQKDFIPNKEVEAIVQKGIEKVKQIFKVDLIEPSLGDNWWMVKSQTPRALTYWYIFKSIPFVDYACYSCEHAVRGNLCKHQIAILLNFLLDCHASTILEYCGTYYG
jgi:hypothetical protein